MAKKTEPLLPRHPSNPVGQVRRIRQASKQVNDNLRTTQKWLVDRVKGLKTVNLSANAAGITVNRYDYLIDLRELEAIVAEIMTRLEGVPKEQVARHVAEAYEEGTSLSVTNLARQTDQYTRTITSVMSSRPWQRRVALIRARVFEEMEGFAGEAGRDLGQVLMRGVDDGRNPLNVARELVDRFGIHRRRARKIARTEITHAMRRARWDETDEAQERLNIRTGLVHLSALSPTTRQSHRARHGNIYTTDQVREWYSHDGNGINCKCTQVETVLNEDGTPMAAGFIEKLKQDQ